METIILHYTILINDGQATLMRFTLPACKDSAPKDIWDHDDAVTDYLIDTYPNPFEPIPEFVIISCHSEGGE